MYMEKIQYITIGTDCAPAAALRTLNLREFALPFDWVQIQPEQLCDIIRKNFHEYHDNLTLCGTRIRNGYGVFFPHDYPTTECTELKRDEEADIGGIPERPILTGWEKHIPSVREKYVRRIHRFHSILSSKEPVIALYRGSLESVPQLRAAFAERYMKHNIVFVVATKEQSSDPYVIACDTEANGHWNDSLIWYDAIEHAKEIAVAL